MRLSIRLTTLAITAVALAGALGAQQRENSHASPRTQAPRGQQAQSRGQQAQSRGQQAPRGYAAPRSYAAPRGQAAPRGGEMASRGPQRAPQDSRGQHYAPARPDNRGGRDYGGARNEPASRNGYRAPQDFNGRNGYRVPVADHGRPLITRSGIRGREGGRSEFQGNRDFGGDRGFRGGGEFRNRREFRDGGWFYGGRAFPGAWESQVVFGGFFPMAYAGYCDTVPYDDEYLLPPMLPSYDPCMFGDRVVVFDRFSRSIVFVVRL